MHGKIFGPIEILAGLYFVLLQFNISFKLFGESTSLIVAIFILGSVVLNFLFGLFSSTSNKGVEVGFLILWAFFPLIFTLSHVAFDIIGIFPDFITSYYFLIMGAMSIVNGIMNFF